MNRLLIFSVCLSIQGLIACTIKTNEAQSDEKIELGHHLFFEKRLSFNNSKSCASCHSPDLAFTDGYRRSVSAAGENLLHNSPGIMNLAENHFFDWDNSHIASLDSQIKRPLYNHHPREMGMDAANSELKEYFQNDSLYRSLFNHAFINEQHFYTAANIEECIVAYVKSLQCSCSKFDKYYAGDQSALNASELRGLKLFNSATLKCGTCHRVPSFTLNDLSHKADSIYANIGLYNAGMQHQYPETDAGLQRTTHQPKDNGKFKIPSLRNVMLTAPYMHDGSISTIQEVIDMYARGGRNIDYGPFKGDGALNKNKHPFITGFKISPQEKEDLIQFLSSLTDTSYLSDKHFQNPFQKE